ncbi:hypothetical protein EWH99_12730 [Sporolactobacillus sp. THM7-7]|nr:hypothetical protein EWH99_12730 [Sporolactobacillus sp. THM7-7]
MGRAATVKADQVRYLQNRVKLLATVIEALDPDTADAEDLNNVLKMMQDLEIRIQRFADDWASGKP